MKELAKDLFSYLGILGGLFGSVYYFAKAASETKRMLDLYGLENIPQEIAIGIIVRNLPILVAFILFTAALLTRLQKKK
ncbi:MAG: hypothetical protein Q4D77_08105 [Peptostreptococcaceae bacterium]|nr:hypothetical protein [Peptostreptococcaceae bacterium]